MPERNEYMPGLMPERDGYIPGVPCCALGAIAPRVTPRAGFLGSLAL